ncbi:DHH family phosphoesterase [Lacrimispora sp.]|jgi:phosphoesterase RecJ-like protein|uniref:DHH family phosphoesterase n=1 Tax=Lacrimispora sp. TaxID=2719234 RepID=UPI0029E04B10|nr:bifunctional oligoribonuclease and phosphatase NrnA [Lacrimispora sp.]
MSFLEAFLKDVKNVAILGHVRPDGDCVGSCLAVYNYLEENCPEIDAVVYLEKPSVKFAYLKNIDRIVSDFGTDQSYDLCICLDSSDTLRFGEAVKYLNAAKKSLCVDHHITNTGYGTENVVKGEASSTCEVLFGLLDENKISKAVAECIYTGIIHDTGVFKYDCTSAKTMEIAGKMMEKGINYSSIIDDSFYRKTYIQNQILGRALLESITFHGGRCIFSAISKKDMDFYGVGSGDMDGIIDQLRITEGVECAIFMYETACREYKVSLRSTTDLDVSKIAVYFGGGGHKKAAGCTMTGNIHDVINNLSDQISRQLN